MNAKKCGRVAVVLAVAGALGTLSLPFADAAPVHSHHALGANFDKNAKRSFSALAAKEAPAALPAAADLSRFAPSPGDQGQVNSCVSWAINYTAYTILEAEQGIAGGPQAPMYTYAQLVKGQNVGTYPKDTLDIAASQGVDARSHYWQGDYDYTTQPDASERANAANWKLSGYTTLNTGNGLQAGVQDSVSKGLPVIITIPVYGSFEQISAAKAADYSYYPGANEKLLGYHEITIIGYNAQGVRVQNQWGGNWGDSGRINLSWNYLAGQVNEAEAVGKLVQ